MSWWGKLLGGAFGYMLGGPLGGLLGAALGHSFDTGLARIQGWSPPRVQEQTQMAFFTATFSVMGHVAKADGRVTHDELRIATHVMRQMRLNGDLTRLAQRLFNEGKAPNFQLPEVLAQFRKECHQNPHLLRLFLEIQLYAALADGDLHPQERRVLIHISEALGFAHREYVRLEAMVSAALKFQRRAGGWKPSTQEQKLDLNDAYALLNVTPDISNEGLKSAFRRLMSQHHPDKLVANGLPEEMRAIATQKTQEIKLAYERIKKARGL